MSTVEIDSGMAWGVTVGGFIANFIIGGLAKSYGIIMEAYLELFETKLAYLTLAGGLIYTFMYGLSLVSHTLSKRYGCRPIVMVGGVGACISLAVAAFATHVVVWVVAIGGGLGISLSLIYSPIFVMMGRCFRRYIGVANGISVAGVSVGQMAFPSILSSLIALYTIRGATLVGAGIMLNFLITGALMPRYIFDPAIPLHEQEKWKLEEKRRMRKMKAAARRELADDVTISVVDSHANSIPTSPTPTPTATSGKESFTPLRASLLAVFIAAKVFGDIGDVGKAFVLPPFGTEQGFNTVQVSLALVVAGGVDLINRLFIGWLSDRPWCRRSALLMVTFLVEGINAFLFTVVDGLAWYCVLYGVFGVCSGINITLMVVVLTDFVGSKHLPISFAIMMLVLGLVIGPGQYFVGYVKDLTGTYRWSLQAVGLMLITSFLILLAEYPLRAFMSSDDKKHPPASGDGVDIELLDDYIVVPPVIEKDSEDEGQM